MTREAEVATGCRNAGETAGPRTAVGKAIVVKNPLNRGLPGRRHGVPGGSREVSPRGVSGLARSGVCEDARPPIRSEVSYAPITPCGVTMNETDCAKQSQCGRRKADAAHPGRPILRNKANRRELQVTPRPGGVIPAEGDWATWG